MKPSLHEKLESLAERLSQLDGLLADPEVIADQQQFTRLSREYAELNPVVQCYSAYRDNEAAIANAEEMLEDAEPEIRALAQDELEAGRLERERLEHELQVLLLPRDPDDESNTFIEIRAGTGGDEASLFAGDLLKMYLRYAETLGWRTELVSTSENEVGGYKEVIVEIVGKGAYSRLKFESGTHRVQRVPSTESQGRIHTSTCTVAVLPEVDEVSEIEINAGELRVDTFRASGAGGQHVNKTDSAIRVTHLPTGTVVECQEERSQHKNRARAMSLLKARLLAAERERQRAERAESRRVLVGSGNRSERIRTYNFPQGRVTDHRINLTLYKLDEVMAGQLDQIIDPLISEHQAELMAAIGG